MSTDWSSGTTTMVLFVRNDQSYSGMPMIYIFDMILSAEEFDTISPGHRGLYKQPDLAKMSGLFDLKRQHIS